MNTTTICFATSLMTIAGLACADVNVTDRRSYLEFESIAGAGPDVDDLRIINPGLEEVSLVAPFVENIEYDAFVDRNDDPAPGSAASSGTADRADTLTYGSIGLTQATVAWTSDVDAEYFDGAGVAAARILNDYRLEFDVTEPTRYRIHGEISAATSGILQDVTLRHDSAFTVVFRATIILGTLGPFDQTGVLQPGAHSLDSAGQIFSQASTAAGVFASESMSNSVTLDLTCLADMDFNYTLNVDDIDGFVTAFLAGSSAADLDSSGTLNVDDIDAFVAAFLGGCS